MKTQYYTAASLDGFIADRRNSLDWLFQFGTEMTTDYPEFIKNVGALVMGSTTYEWILEHHIRAGSDRERPWDYEQPAWVMTSRALPTVTGADIRFASGDVTAVHREMCAAAGDKNIWLVGGGDLVGQFHEHGLLDEIIVTIASVTLGAGAPFLPREVVTPPLKLRSATMLTEGFAQLRYDVR
ncbi:MAG TPA: dihydrofolate reductase family protein [Gemmatimonadaceae bacterium]|jgi:dihydrofolate reductase